MKFLPVRKNHSELRRNSYYVCLTPWCRLIFEDGKYMGWYNPRTKSV